MGERRRASKRSVGKWTKGSRLGTRWGGTGGVASPRGLVCGAAQPISASLPAARRAVRSPGAEWRSSDLHPCPCGYWGHPERECRCSGEALARHREHLSGPVVDRIDVMIEVPPLTTTMLDGGEGPSSAAVQARVLAARAFRALREAGGEVGHSGNGLRARPVSRTGAHPGEVELRYAVTQEARALLREALLHQALGGRGYMRVLAVARTLADLEGVVQVKAAHVAEALAFRIPSMVGWRS
ncbi:MAG: ATP-binding protein [Thermoleophilia bacterium]|nr:ATP-binding protein [Thermoleophilia bacterium]